ncbi:hypothetical protein ACLMJK_001718 [Lecanora helva]
MDEKMQIATSELSLSPCPFGRTMREKHFLFAPTYTPLNHGSFGTYPKSVQKRFHEVQALSEARPDSFVRYQCPKMLDESRAALADYLEVPINEVVFVPNATTAINVVLRSLVYNKGDVILHLSTLYGSVEKTIEYLRETTEVDSMNVAVKYPIDDGVLAKRFENAIKVAKSDGKVVRIAIFDTISSLPGAKVPWEQLVQICNAEGVLSLVDGAHGVGQIPLNLSSVQPDFFTSNCHKWLYVPRGCAMFYVPQKNQHLIRSSLPTSHGFKPLPQEGRKEIFNPLMSGPSTKNDFEMLFEFVATLDVSPYLCITEALKFRSDICGGEDEILRYCQNLATEVAQLAAKEFGTEVMQNKEETLTKCFMVNVRLPLTIGNEKGGIPEQDTYTASVWMTSHIADEYDMYSPVFAHAGKFWTRWSAQVYLEVDDFVKGIDALKSICERAQKGEYL